MNHGREVEQIYFALFNKKSLPNGLALRYEAALEDLKLPPVTHLNSHEWSSLELTFRNTKTPEPHALRMLIVAYLAETSDDHFELFHRPRPRSAIVILVDMAFSFLKSILLKINGMLLRRKYGL